MAVVAQQWAEPRFLVEPSRPIGWFGENVSLMFLYRQQRDPDRVFDDLAS